MSLEKIDVLGLGFHSVTVEEAVSLGASWLAEEGFHYVVTPNPEFILMSQKDATFHQTLQEADLVLPDGIGVIYSAKILGRPLGGRVPGIDFAWGLMETIDRGIALGGSSSPVGTGGLFLLGAKDGVAKQAGELLGKKYPHLKIAGSHHGYFSAEEDGSVAQIVKESGADVLFVCLGAPRQEIFLSRYGAMTGVKVGVGLGGALDVFAGNIERAPESWQKMNLEWLYRLKKEPKRIGRMAKLPLVLVQATKKRLIG